MATITESQAQCLREAAAGSGLSEGTLREDYSGRGMYGRTCIGLAVDSPGQAGEILIRLALYGNQESRELAEYLANARSASDSLGRGIIIYYPEIRYAG